MSETLTAMEVNCATGQTTIRPLTTEEIAQREADAVAFAARKAEEDAAAEAKATLKASAKAKYDVWPSAYASGYVQKCVKRGGKIK